MQKVEVAGRYFWVRADTSDILAVRENMMDAPAGRHLSVGPGQNWLDLGAYVGSFAVWLRSRGARVFWVEADSDSADIARANLQLNGFGRTPGLVAAVVQTPPDGGTVDLIRGPVGRGRVNHWSNTIYNKWKREYPTRPCPAIGFEDVVAEAVGRLGTNDDLHLKMDIEGAELDILENADLSLFGQIYFEYHFQADLSVSRAHRIIARLEDLGFAVRTNRRLPTGPAPQYFSEMIFTAWARRS